MICMNECIHVVDFRYTISLVLLVAFVLKGELTTTSRHAPSSEQRPPSFRGLGSWEGSGGNKGEHYDCVM